MKSFATMLAALICSMLWVFPENKAFAQTGGEINGTATDQTTGKPLLGATVSVQGTKLGATTNPKGQFSIKGVPAGAYTLIASFIGYDKLTAQVTVRDGEVVMQNLTMVAGAVKLEDLIVVSTSRKAEKITESPATIQAIRGQEILQMPIIGQALMNARGVDIVRSGVDGIGFNARGFNSAFNTKILAMNDGRFSTLPGNGLPIGNLNTNIKEDIEQIELILGPSSALYGPNAHNGIVNTISRDPRTSQGTTFALNYGTQNFFSARARHAGVLGNFAFKASFEYNTARDFEFIDSVYGIVPAASNPVGSGRVAEFQPNFDIRHVRFEATGIYSLAENTDIYLSYGRSANWGLGPTNPGRNYINGWEFQYAQVKFVSPRFFAQAYYTWNNSGSTYPVQNVTRLMNRTPIVGPTYDPIRDKVLAGTVTVDEAIQASKFVEKSGRWNAEAQYNDNIAGFDVVLGINYQLDVPSSEGTYLSDVLVGGSRRTITPIMQIGGAFQLEREIVDNFKVVLAGRLDRHDNFGVFFAPKAALVYKALGGSFRATYGRGINTPTVLNQEIYIPAGGTATLPITLRGNGKGFTLANSTVIDKLRPEIIDTFEAGYKGMIADKLYVDVNAYYGMSTDFISPNIVLGVANTGVGTPPAGTKTADNATTVFPGATTAQELVLSYVNFGRVNAFGVDVGINYFVTDNISIGLNYSWFGSDLDITKRDDRLYTPTAAELASNTTPPNRLIWDVTEDRFVSPGEISLNTPTHKGSVTLNASKLFDGKFFGSLGVRFISAYTFVSGVHYAGPALPGQQLGNRAIVPRDPTQPLSATNLTLAAFNVNRGPLGGFATVDLSLGYNILDNLMVSVAVSNLLDTEQREMVGSPLIRRMIVGELRYTIPAFY
jgi:iron complex outermembrane receptor protein